MPASDEALPPAASDARGSEAEPEPAAAPARQRVDLRGELVGARQVHPGTVASAA
mgnify:CR=1 FL=1